MEAIFIALSPEGPDFDCGRGMAVMTLETPPYTVRIFNQPTAKAQPK
jgi:hypothetical protein